MEELNLRMKEIESELSNINIRKKNLNEELNILKLKREKMVKNLTLEEKLKYNGIDISIYSVVDINDFGGFFAKYLRVYDKVLYFESKYYAITCNEEFKEIEILNSFISLGLIASLLVIKEVKNGEYIYSYLGRDLKYKNGLWKILE